MITRKQIIKTLVADFAQADEVPEITKPLSINQDNQLDDFIDTLCTPDTLESIGFQLHQANGEL